MSALFGTAHHAARIAPEAIDMQRMAELDAAVADLIETPRRNFAPSLTRALTRARLNQPSENLRPKPDPRLLRVDRIARRGFIPAWEILCEIWNSRACLICGKFGHCRHREPEFDWAELECVQRRMEAAGKVTK